MLPIIISNILYFSPIRSIITIVCHKYQYHKYQYQWTMSQSADDQEYCILFQPDPKGNLIPSGPSPQTPERQIPVSPQQMKSNTSNTRCRCDACIQCNSCVRQLRGLLEMLPDTRRSQIIDDQTKTVTVRIQNSPRNVHNATNQMDGNDHDENRVIIHLREDHNGNKVGNGIPKEQTIKLIFRNCPGMMSQPTQVTQTRKLRKKRQSKNGSDRMQGDVEPTGFVKSSPQTLPVQEQTRQSFGAAPTGVSQSSQEMSYGQPDPNSTLLSYEMSPTEMSPPATVQDVRHSTRLSSQGTLPTVEKAHEKQVSQPEAYQSSHGISYESTPKKRQSSHGSPPPLVTPSAKFERILRAAHHLYNALNEESNNVILMPTLQEYSKNMVIRRLPDFSVPEETEDAAIRESREMSLGTRQPQQGARQSSQESHQDRSHQTQQEDGREFDKAMLLAGPVPITARHSLPMAPKRKQAQKATRHSTHVASRWYPQAEDERNVHGSSSLARSFSAGVRQSLPMVRKSKHAQQSARHSAHVLAQGYIQPEDGRQVSEVSLQRPISSGVRHSLPIAPRSKQQQQFKRHSSNMLSQSQPQDGSEDDQQSFDEAMLLAGPVPITARHSLPMAPKRKQPQQVTRHSTQLPSRWYPQNEEEPKFNESSSLARPNFTGSRHSLPMVTKEKHVQQSARHSLNVLSQGYTQHEDGRQVNDVSLSTRSISSGVRHSLPIAPRRKQSQRFERRSSDVLSRSQPADDQQSFQTSFLTKPASTGARHSLPMPPRRKQPQQFARHSLQVSSRGHQQVDVDQQLSHLPLFSEPVPTEGRHSLPAPRRRKQPQQDIRHSLQVLPQDFRQLEDESQSNHVSFPEKPVSTEVREVRQFRHSLPSHSKFVRSLSVGSPSGQQQPEVDRQITDVDVPLLEGPVHDGVRYSMPMLSRPKVSYVPMPVTHEEYSQQQELSQFANDNVY